MIGVQLSVVITVHDQPRELARLLGKLGDVPSEVELIVVDDFSREENADAERRIVGASRTPIRFLALDEWHGCGGARNAGERIANGEWVWFVDGDDEINPRAFAHILDAIENTTKDVLLLDYEIVKGDGSTDVVRFENCRLELWEIGIMAWCKVIRRAALIPFREKIMYEDNDWWMRQCLECQGYDTVYCVTAYRYHQLAAGSATAVIEQLKVPHGADPASVPTLDSFLARGDERLTTAIAWLMEDLAALLKVRVDAMRYRMGESYFNALDYMIRYFKTMLRVR